MGPEALVRPTAAAGSAASLGKGGARVVGPSYASFVLIGWAGLLVPTLIRVIEQDFRQSDAGLGIHYLLYAVFYALGAAGGGVLAGRLPRRQTLPLAAVLLAAGLAGLALAPGWEAFLAATAPFGLGAGAIDAGVNGLFLDLHPGRGAPISLLHLFYSGGTLGAPLVVGLLVAAGVPWRYVLLSTAAGALVVGLLLAGARLPERRSRPLPGPGREGELSLGSWPVLLLGFAIAAYVASAIGLTSWLVEFLAAAPLGVATGALALVSAGQAAGRLIAARVADWFRPVPFAAGCAAVSGIAVVGGVVAPALPLSIALFGVAGLAQGPIYPLIMTIGGTLQPRRSDAVSGFLTTAGVLGRLVYPPLIGLASAGFGIGAGILGAGALGLAAAATLVVMPRPRALTVRTPSPSPSTQEP